MLLTYVFHFNIYVNTFPFQLSYITIKQNNNNNNNNNDKNNSFITNMINFIRFVGPYFSSTY